MRLIRHLARIVFLTAYFAVLNVAQAGNGATMTMQAWPAPVNCDPCLPFQLGLLDMKLPLTQIGKILSLGTEQPGIFLVPSNNDMRFAAMFRTIKPEQLINRYGELGLLDRPIMGNEAFFDQLGRSADQGGAFEKLRRIHGLDKAQRYIKFSRNGVHAYVIQSVPPNFEIAYFVVDGHEITYALDGPFTPDMLGAVMSNLKLAPVP